MGAKADDASLKPQAPNVTPLPDDVVAKHRATLEAFVARARRIETHSLVQDREAFLRWVSGTVKMDFVVDQATGQAAPERMVWDLPPEEAFESLASRVRPLILQGEPIHFHKVFGALNAFARDDPELRAQVAKVRQGWAEALDPKEPIRFGLVNDLERPDVSMSFVDIADAWLYGDLVHADPVKRELIASIPLSQRYVAAALAYGKVVLHALVVLAIVRSLQDSGRLELDSTVFDAAVSVDLPLVVEVERAVFSPRPAPSD